ncbi:T-cell surface glycoprotein CD3 epsilon chain-like [Siphateles boraxobius]|uniref:T-cell surface glycoprotein CD3 epsilon chain-like n=1 Tax=Siphateles boraxobius TaxID=180520 RepID=UPI00406376CD
MILTGLVFLMLTAAADSQEISITNTGVVLTCYGGGEGDVKWMKEKVELTTEKNKETTVLANQGVVKGEFSCEYSEGSDKVTDLFYLDVKVCENCYELSGMMASGVIFGDLLITGAVILIVYMCVRKNTGSTQQRASKPRAAGAPPVPNPDYEMLNQHTRSADVYAGLK